MNYLKPFPTLAVGVVIGYFLLPKAMRLVRK
jgi:hypothetical protein